MENWKKVKASQNIVPKFSASKFVKKIENLKKNAKKLVPSDDSELVCAPIAQEISH